MPVQFDFTSSVNYFQHHPFLHWLMSVGITFALMAGGGLLLHEKNWPLLIGWSIAVPTATAAVHAMRKRW